jgi:hypothetical protein
MCLLQFIRRTKNARVEERGADEVGSSGQRRSGRGEASGQSEQSSGEGVGG